MNSKLHNGPKSQIVFKKQNLIAGLVQKDFASIEHLKYEIINIVTEVARKSNIKRSGD